MFTIFIFAINKEVLSTPFAKYSWAL